MVVCGHCSVDVSDVEKPKYGYQYYSLGVLLIRSYTTVNVLLRPLQ